jgi:anti-sigma B factor antagonist
MAMDFILEYSEDIVIAVVKIRRATFLEALQFQNMLTNEIENGCRKAIVDLSGCSSIDPAFFSAIIITFKKIINLGGNLKLVRPKNYLDDYEKLENNIRVFEIFSSKEDALESYKMIFNKPGDTESQITAETAVRN